MLVKTYCAAINGLEVTTVTVEISVEAGQCLYLSGLGDEAVRESQSRIRTAYLLTVHRQAHVPSTHPDIRCEDMGADDAQTVEPRRLHSNSPPRSDGSHQGKKGRI